VTGRDLSDENRHYRSLYLNMPVMMFVADERGRIVEISDRLVERLGGTHRNRVDAQAVELFGPADAAVVAGALLEGDCRDLAVTLAADDGRTLPCEMTCRLGDIGSPGKLRLCVLNDVSGRDRAREAIEERNRRLAMANEDLDRFALVASHDLQEPLRKIRQFSGFLQADHADRMDADGRYHLKVIVAAAERMSTLIGDLLDYARTGRDVIEPRRLSVRAVVEEVLDELDLRVREADALVTIGELPVLSADPVLVRQLVANLIGNALKYRDGERRLQLSIRQGVPGPRADTIAFTDNGIGFDPGHAGRILEPFTRLDTGRARPGSGLGLAICATVCERHGWRLEADGAPGRGSTFRVRFATPADPSVDPSIDPLDPPAPGVRPPDPAGG